jgi:hypothetical protein
MSSIPGPGLLPPDKRGGSSWGCSPPSELEGDGPPDLRGSSPGSVRSKRASPRCGLTSLARENKLVIGCDVPGSLWCSSFLEWLALESRDILDTYAEVDSSDGSLLLPLLLERFADSFSSTKSPRRSLSRSKLSPGRYDTTFAVERAKKVRGFRGGPSIFP